MTIDYVKQREEAKKVGYEKLNARMLVTYNTIAAALEAAGVKLKPRKSRDAQSFEAHYVFELTERAGIWDRITLEARVKNGRSYYADAPTGKELLVFAIGSYGSTTRIRSAKEDPDLTGVRVARCVECVVRAIAAAKARKEDTRTREANEEASNKIAVRCNKLAKDGAIRFRSIETRPDEVLLTIENIEVNEKEAKEFVAALAPLINKVRVREAQEERARNK